MDIASLDRWAVQGTSPWHRASPLAKVIATGLFVLAVLIGSDPATLIALYLVLASLMAFARLPLRRVLVLAAYPAVFALLFAVSRWDGTWQTPAVILLKSVGAAMTMVLLITTTPYPDLFAALGGLLPRLVSDALFMTYRSFFVLLEAMDHLIISVRLRGGLQVRRPLRTVSNLALALGVLLIHAVDMAQRLYEVLLMRGYGGRFPTGRRWRAMRLSLDWLPVFCGMVALAAALAGQWTGGAYRYPLGGPAVALVGLTGGLLLRRAQGGEMKPGRPAATMPPPPPVWSAAVGGGGEMAEPEHGHPEVKGEIVAHVSCVRHTYADKTVVSLCGLDFVVTRGQKAVILGPNGSGKSTLLYHLLGLLKPDEGSVSLFGKDPARDWGELSRRVGVVLQNVEEQLLAPTVYDDIAFSPRNYGHSEDQVREMVERAMEWLEISHLQDKVPHDLSGGEKRKVALAGALVLQPEMLIMDEPFEGLDPKARDDLISLLNRLNAEKGTTLIVTTHDVDTVPRFADAVFMLVAGGQIVQRGTHERIFSRADLLARSNVEPPVLSQLFDSLRQCGLDLGHPMTVEEAASALMSWFVRPEEVMGRQRGSRAS